MATHASWCIRWCAQGCCCMVEAGCEGHRPGGRCNAGGRRAAAIRCCCARLPLPPPLHPSTCSLHLRNLTCRTCALPLQQSYFHPCEWDDHNCHRDLSMKRAVGLVNLTRWVACAVALLLPLLLALAPAPGLWSVAALRALLPLLLVPLGLCRTAGRAALPPPSSQGCVASHHVPLSLAAQACRVPPLCSKLGGRRRGRSPQSRQAEAAAVWRRLRRRRYLRQQPVLHCTGCPIAPTCIQDHVTCGCSRSLYPFYLFVRFMHRSVPKTRDWPLHCPRASLPTRVDSAPCHVLAISHYTDAVPKHTLVTLHAHGRRFSNDMKASGCIES